MGDPQHRAVAAVAAALALAGCGGDGDDAPQRDRGATTAAAERPNAQRLGADAGAVAGLVDDLTAAARAGDAGRICTQLFSPGLAEDLATDGRPCEDRVTEQLVRDDAQLEVVRLTVRGDVASSLVREPGGAESTLGFERQAGGWRIVEIRASA